MLKRAFTIAFAFIGALVGAGFASGQEAMQYFVAFGNWGLVGAVVSSVIMFVAGIAILQLGSYFQAKEHMAVLGRISSKVVAWALDIATVITLFAIGFVMFSGGGANLNQQFGLPTWIGALVMVIMVLVVGLLEVDKVTTAIGLLTPFLILFVMIACGWTLITVTPDFAAMNLASAEVQTGLPNWWISALNYTGLNFICVVSMAVVIGGNTLDTKTTGWGGLLGGIAYLIMLLLLSSALFVKVETVSGADMPVLILINEINPVLGVIMALIIYGMVFSTAIAMFYALGKRLTAKNPKRFYPVFAASVIIGFGLSFIPFTDLVSVVYPLLGYMGVLLVIVVSGAWLRGRSKLSRESRIRIRALDLTRRKMDPRLRFSKMQQRELARLTAASAMPAEMFEEALSDEVSRELSADRELEYDPEETESDLVYVSYTEPVTQEEYEQDGPVEADVDPDEDVITDEEWAEWAAEDAAAKAESESESEGDGDARQ